MNPLKGLLIVYCIVKCLSDPIWLNELTLRRSLNLIRRENEAWAAKISFNRWFNYTIQYSLYFDLAGWNLVWVLLTLVPQKKWDTVSDTLYRLLYRIVYTYMYVHVFTYVCTIYKYVCMYLWSQISRKSLDSHFGMHLLTCLFYSVCFRALFHG